jgi:peptide/nickel transport system substrate-binding protein
MVLLVLVGACGGDGHDPALERGNNLVVLYGGSDEWVFSPGYDDSPKFLVFEPLATQAAGWCSEITGGLGASWEHNDDQTEWTTHLRPGVRWHDGRPVTAWDVAQNLEVWKDPDVAWYAGSLVEDWEVLDSLTFRVSLRQPGIWPRDNWDVIYPGHILSDLPREDFFEWEFWTRPVGNGPFRFSRMAPKTFVELVANDDYYLGRPSVDTLTLQFQSGSGSGVVELRAGNVDMAALDPLDALTLADDPRFNVYYLMQAMPEFLVWNTSRGALADVRVRQALAHASDRQGLGAVLGLPDALPISDAPVNRCREPFVPPYEYSPERAAELLTEAGWVDADGDGIREKNGVPLSFTVTTIAQRERPIVYLTEQWKAVGIDARIRTLESSVVHQLTLDGDFEAVLPQNVRAAYLAVTEGSPIGIVDEELAGLVTAWREEVDAHRGDAAGEAMATRYKELAPALFLNFRVGALVAHRRVRGLGEPGSILPVLGFRHPFGDLTKVWVERE